MQVVLQFMIQILCHTLASQSFVLTKDVTLTFLSYLSYTQQSKAGHSILHLYHLDGNENRMAIQFLGCGMRMVIILLKPPPKHGVTRKRELKKNHSAEVINKLHNNTSSQLELSLSYGRPSELIFEV